MTDFVVVLTTLPADFDAATLAEALVAERLAACVNILPPMQSVYRWKGAVERDREQQLVIKTARARVDALWTALAARHPYEVPEFVVIGVSDGQKAYLDWIADSVTPVL